eukprot:10709714-Lingulodinium_polyedra.AAC.1
MHAALRHTAAMANASRVGMLRASTKTGRQMGRAHAQRDRRGNIKWRSRARGCETLGKNCATTRARTR